MRKACWAALILGLLFVDFLYFHDIFKPGEVTTMAQYLSGALSVPVILYSAHALLSHKARHRQA